MVIKTKYNIYLGNSYVVANVYARSDGRFCTAWQIQGWLNHEPVSFVLSDDDTVVVEREHGECVRCVGVDDEELSRSSGVD
ncbi:MAG: hypothetical protein A07HB70_02158 [uncultured archaeon A07HB70]|nr:MAG: hypothetical protein A07HB70_02158 [uncultured archaeon A07HB70]